MLLGIRAYLVNTLVQTEFWDALMWLRGGERQSRVQYWPDFSGFLVFWVFGGIFFAAERDDRKKAQKTRKPLKCISLAENISSITAIGNDFDFESIFSRQLEAIGQKGDLLIGISTSGLSKNIKKAFMQAKKMNICTAGFFGMKITQISKLCDVSINIKSNDTARIQEMHILTIHIICQILDETY